MNQNGHGHPQQNSQFDSRARYILFTSKVKHGHLLRYLLAAQARKRLLETYGLRRQVKSSALTGDPDHVFEVYYVEQSDWLDQGTDPVQSLAGMMSNDDASLYQELQASIEAECIPALEFLVPDRPQIPLIRTLLQMPYMTTEKTQQEIARALATEPYLLNDICVMKHHENGMDDKRELTSALSEFNDDMSELILSFAQSGFSLLVGAQFEDHPDWVLNIWQFSDLEQHTELMLKLADNQTYDSLDRLCHQEQHICRNVSRHHQQQPLLML
jgi:hypothetical protein